MQLLKAMENCPAKSTHSSLQPQESLSQLALPKSKSSRSHTLDRTQQSHSQSWQRHLVPPTLSWRLPLLPSHHLTPFSYSLTSQSRQKPTKTAGASSKAVKKYNPWWYLKKSKLLLAKLSVFCSPAALWWACLKQLSRGSQAPAWGWKRRRAVVQNKQQQGMKQDGTYWQP